MHLVKIGKHLINLDRIDYVCDDSSNHVKFGAQGTKNKETGLTTYSADDLIWQPRVVIHFGEERLSLTGEEADAFLALAIERVSPRH